MKLQWFPWLPFMQFRRMGVFRYSNEQFGTHEKLSPSGTLYVNCMKHDPIDLIYNFTLSKALLIHIYIVSIWCMTSFTIHPPSFEYVPIYDIRLILAGNLSIYRQDCKSAYSVPYSMIQANIELFNFQKLEASRATCSSIR